MGGGGLDGGAVRVAGKVRHPGGTGESAARRFLDLHGIDDLMIFRDLLGERLAMKQITLLLAHLDSAREIVAARLNPDGVLPVARGCTQNEDRCLVCWVLLRRHPLVRTGG